LSDESGRFVVMRDWRGGLEYLRSQSALVREGLYLELDAYRCMVFAEIRDVVDTDGRWGRLADWLGGRGVPSLEVAMREMELAPLHQATRDLWAARTAPEFDGALERLNIAVGQLSGLNDVQLDGVDVFSGRGPSIFGWRGDVTERDGEEHLIAERAWRFTDAIETAIASVPALARGRWLDRWRMKPVLTEVMRQMNLGPMSFGYDTQMPEIAGVLLSRDGRPLDADALADPEVRRAIGANEHDGVTWFGKEAFERFVDWLQVPELERQGGIARSEAAKRVIGYMKARAKEEPNEREAVRRAERLDEAAARSGYRLDRLADELRSHNRPQSPMPRTPQPSSVRKRDRGAG